MLRKQVPALSVLALTAAGLLLAGTTAAQQHRSQHVVVTHTSTSSGGGLAGTVSPGTMRFQRVSSGGPFFFVPFGNTSARGLSPSPITSWYSSTGGFPVSYGADSGYRIVASSSHPSGTRSARGVAPVAYESPAAADPSRIVVLKFLMPTANAELWLEGRKVDFTGRVRQFVSPPLELGVKYAYTVRARWVQGGREVSQTQEVAVSAGDRNSVEFAAAAAAPEGRTGRDGSQGEGRPKP